MVMLIVVVEDKISMIACAQHVLESARTHTHASFNSETARFQG